MIDLSAYGIPVSEYSKFKELCVNIYSFVANEEYANFQNAGYMGLYGGLTVQDIHERKNLKESEKILDFMEIKWYSLTVA